MNKGNSTAAKADVVEPRDQPLRHTPGPWFVSSQGTYIRAESPKGFNIASMECFVQMHEGETQANARLIAAAPELAEALREFVRLDEESELAATDGGELVSALTDARRALAKL